MLDHQNKLIAETPKQLSEKLLSLKNQREIIKEKNKKNKVERQILTSAERREILKKTDGRCHICGGLITGKWDADHVMAHSGGGTHKIDNYLPAHSLCNNYRWDYLDEEFQLIMKIGIWSKKQIEDKTNLGLKLAEGFIKYEQSRLKRRKR
jgi:5-methylcytosine-specific restriction endonuclease McrA